MSMKHPSFPDFRPIELEDRSLISDVLRVYNPKVSEMTFTNLFIWRAHYGLQWSVYKDWLLFYCSEAAVGPFAFQPVGAPSRREAVEVLLTWLRDDRKIDDPRIERADERLVSELGSTGEFSVEPLRDHFDYVYQREDLTKLAGNKYRAKRNHINRLLRFYDALYEPLDERHVAECLVVQEKWCRMNRCKEDLDLLGEHEAIKEILTHREELQVEGAVIIVEDRVGAFTLGEKLNSETAVIHIEKADPDIAELYSFINQQFCEKRWQDVLYINREQDLGLAGLREAKLSYQPDHFVEKFRIRPSQGR